MHLRRAPRRSRSFREHDAARVASRCVRWARRAARGARIVGDVDVGEIGNLGARVGTIDLERPIEVVGMDPDGDPCSTRRAVSVLGPTGGALGENPALHPGRRERIAQAPQPVERGHPYGAQGVCRGDPRFDVGVVGRVVALWLQRRVERHVAIVAPRRPGLILGAA